MLCLALRTIHEHDGWMQEPHPVDPEVVRRMRQLILISIARRSQAWTEAAAEARGLCRGLQPALPKTMVDQAVACIIRDLDLVVPSPEVVPVEGRRLVVAGPVEVADSLAHAMRFNERGKARRSGASISPRLRQSSWSGS